MFDDFGLLVGEFNTVLPTLSDGQKNELQLDSLGRLIISGRYLEDAAHSSGDAGIFMMAVRRDADTTMVYTDGDYAPLQVDENGRLKVVADIEVVNGHEKLEDAAHASGDVGSYMLSVRVDDITAANTAFLAGTEGDYQSLLTSSNGELYVVNEKVKYAEDSGHTSGDEGNFILAVRNDSLSSLVGTDLDYAPLQVDELGRLKVRADIDALGNENYTVTDDLAAAGDGLETITETATPWITVATFALGVAETAYLYGWQWACDQNAHARIVTDDNVDVIVYKNSLNSSAMPERDEHFCDSGRIEFAGATDLSIKLQIKKRQATGGDAKGTGSLHLRKL